MRRRSKMKGLIFVALGLGLLMSLLLPQKFIIIMLAALLVICGIALCRI